MMKTRCSLAELSLIRGQNTAVERTSVAVPWSFLAHRRVCVSCAARSRSLMNMLKIACAVALATVVGCQPKRIVVQHGQTGIVRDSAGAPIAGADVLVEFRRTRATE